MKSLVKKKKKKYQIPMNIKFKTIILILSFLFIAGCNKQKVTLYTKTVHYFDNDIEIKLYTTSSSKASKAFDDIADIYSTYEKISNRNNKNSEISYIFNNHSKEKSIKVSNEMKELIEFGIEWYKNSDGLININSGDIIDLWDDKYKQNLIPTLDDLKSVSDDINQIDLKGNNIINNHVNMSFNSYIQGYTNKKVKDYLKSVHIDTYFINTGNGVMVGKGKDNEDYVIALSNPFDDSLLQMFSIQNKYLVTKSIYYKSYKYDDKLYSNIVNGKSKFMSDNMISITVVSDDPALGDVLSDLLFLTDYDNGYKIATKYNIQAIWCYYDELGNEVIKKTDNL